MTKNVILKYTIIYIYICNRIRKLFAAYMEQKIEPIVAIIEPSMYVGKYQMKLLLF